MPKVNKLPVPPPLERVTEPLIERDVVPGEYLKDTKQGFLEEFLVYNNPVKDYIDAYNHWVNVHIERRLKAEKMRITSNSHAEIVRVVIPQPTIISSDRGNIPLYPLKCRNDSYSYMSTIYVDISLFENGRCTESTLNVEFGKIPVMLKSILCYLNGLDAERLLKLGECPIDPGSYFIIKGTEKLIITQEKLKYNEIFITFSEKDSKKQEVICKMTNYFIRGTSIIKLKSLKTGGIRVELKFLQNGNTLSVFQIFRLFGIKTTEEMENIVLLFTRNDRRKIALSLISSFNDIINIADDIVDIEIKRGKYPETFTQDDKLNSIIESINQELFPHMEGEPPIKKLYLLSIMIVRLAEYKTGFRSLDDRDDWGRKRIETPSESLRYLFNQVTKYVFDSINASIQASVTKNEPVNLNLIRKLISSKKKDVTETFIESFNTNNWGVKAAKHTKQQNITDNFIRESTLSNWYQTVKITANTSRQTKQSKIRDVQMSQDNFIDIVDTPETDQCGLIKYKAITAIVSLDREEYIIRHYIKSYIENDPNPDLEFCLLNGKFLGWCNGKILEKYIRSLKTTKRISRDIAVVYDIREGSVKISTDGQRLTIPLLVVDQETGELVYEQLKKEHGEDFVSSFQNLERSGAIEYVDPAEYSNLHVSESIKEFKSYKYLYLEAQKHKEEDYFAKLIEETDNEMVNYYGKRFIYGGDIAKTYDEFRNRFTHVKLDPNSIFGPISSTVILSDHTQGPRNSYTCRMTRQAAGIYHSNHLFRFDTPAKLSATPSRPIFRTKTNKALGLEELPYGDTVILMFGSYAGYSQEDGIIMKEGAINRGLFMRIIYKSYKSSAKSTSDYVEEFTRPPGNEHRFRHLDDNGLARPGSRVMKDDVIIAKKRTFTTKFRGEDFNFEYTSVGINEDGVVEISMKTTNPEGHPVVRVKVRKVKKPKVGDKFASRTAQKSTIGLVLPDVYMPFDENGISPDIIINPHSIPSRMTISKLYEMVASEYGARTGQYIDATSFDNFNIEDAKKYFRMKGMDEYNNVTMYSGFTGEKLTVDIFVGPCYYMTLKHLVDEKIQTRASGKIDFKTRQPVSGRKAGGGLRLGEMEKDVFVSHGASRIVRERLFLSSDLWSAVVCRTCGNLAVSYKDNDTTYNTCGVCDTNAKFGICRFPYVLKTVFDLLTGMGINVKFKTEIAEDYDISGLERINRETIGNDVDLEGESLESEEFE